MRNKNRKSFGLTHRLPKMLGLTLEDNFQIRAEKFPQK